MAEPVVAGLAIRDDQTTFDDNQLRALRELHPDLYGTSAAQAQVFFHCCRASGLDPFANQIYMIQRGAGNDRRWTVQTGIGGYRLIARRAVDRAKEDLSYEDTVWFDQDGTEYNVWLRKEPPHGLPGHRVAGRVTLSGSSALDGVRPAGVGLRA